MTEDAVFYRDLLEEVAVLLGLVGEKGEGCCETAFRRIPGVVLQLRSDHTQLSHLRDECYQAFLRMHAVLFDPAEARDSIAASQGDLEELVQESESECNRLRRELRDSNATGRRLENELAGRLRRYPWLEEDSE